MPHLALPALSFYLRAHGHDVTQRDLNLEVFEHMLTRSYLQQSLARLKLGRAPARQASAPPRERLLWALQHGPQLAEQVEQAVAVMRSPAFLDGEAGLRAFLTVARSLELASLPYYPASLDLLGFRPAAAMDSSRALLQAVRDEQHNPFLDIFRRGIIRDLVALQPELVGISIPTEGQMLAGMTLAHLIKQAKLPCHVTVGGPQITMLREQLPQAPAVFTLIDSAVAFEGEEPLLRLAEALAAGGGPQLAQVPNLVWRDGSEIRANPVTPRGDLRPATAELPLPDFDGLPLGRYLAPYPILPLLTAHGCYHGRCAFCNVGYGRAGHYRPIRSEQVVEQMLALRRKYGARHIFFADEAMTLRNMREMSALLAEQAADGVAFHWGGCMRFEKALTHELLESMAAAGCRMILFGLETASERMIKHMSKGVERDHMGRILRESTAAGIWNHTFFFFGFPTETLDDAQDTVNFVYAHGDVIHSASPGEFVLERYSPVHRDPQKFGVRRIKPAADLAIYFDYELESGLDEQTAHTITERLLDVLPRKRYGQYYAQDAYRLIYAGHLHEQGLPLPAWLADEAAG
ncbi:MAG: Ribosomal protein S12 methylthiotransferase RimO [Chloroflexi bacterium ADurb.Bin325]|nr:MAG: Ribosomal protein S12 methylthiotransferase RimO [Chloroflexi bacterium ADurb.Bin325]